MNNINLVLFALLAIFVISYFSLQIVNYSKSAYEFLSKGIKLPVAERAEEKIQAEEQTKTTQPTEQKSKIELKKLAGGKIIFDQSHENGFAAFGENGVYSKFAGKFIDAGYQFETVNEIANFSEQIKEAKILIIAKPLTDYSKEKQQVLELVREGVVLVLIGDVDKTATGNLNELSVPTGINFNRDFLYDLHENAKLYSYIFIKDFREHEITKDLEKVILYESCSLDVFDKGKSLAFTGSTTRSNLGEKNLTAIAVSTHGQGSIFAICDGDIWTNEKLNHLDNENLLINLINWLQTK